MKTLSIFQLTIFTLLLLVINACSISAQKSATKDSFQLMLENTIKEHEIPAMAVAVVRGDEILDIAVVGTQKNDNKKGLDLNSRFHIGSNTKAMTAYIAAAMVEEELLTWNTELLKVFPAFKDSCNAAYIKVRLQDLLSHRSGIAPYTAGNEFFKIPTLKGDNGTEKRKAFTAWLLQQEPVEIDKKNNYTYSNAGYGVAASMLEEVSGMTWNELMDKYLLKPLNIKAAYGWPAKEDTTQAWGHWDVFGDGVSRPHDPNGMYKLDDYISPAGDANMSIIDYAKYLQDHLRGLNGKKAQLSAESYEFMHYGNLDFSNYSMGWGSVLKDDVHASTHDGSAGTFYCHAIILKEKNIAIAIFTNTADQKAIKGIYQMRNKLMKQYKK